MDAPHRTRRTARGMRKAMSLPEVLLWKALKNQKLDGLRFRRQHPVGPYVPDFFCDEAGLCVELDGQGHGFGDRPARDERRDAWLAERGIVTVRLSAEPVLNDVDDAVTTIRGALERR